MRHNTTMTAPIVFVPHSPHFGGAEKHLIELVRSICRTQACAIWYDPIDFYSARLQDRPEIAVRLRPYRISHRTVLRFWLDLVKLRPRVVVFVKGIADIYPWSAYLAARLSGTDRVLAIEQLIADPAPAVVTETGVRGWIRRVCGWRARYMWAKWLQGQLAHVTVAVSEAVRRRLIEEYGYPADKTMTIYNGVELSAFAGPETSPPRIASFGRDSDRRPFSIVCVARLSPVKRIDLLLEALALLAQRHHSWVCRVVGGGPLEAELRAKAQALGLNLKVEFTGYVDDVRSYLQAADLAVLPSEKEGLPLSLVEAMACGLPCVVTDVGGNREIVLEGRTGLLVEFGSPTRLAEAIAFMLEKPAERRRMGHEAKKFVYERFDMKQMINSYRAILLSPRQELPSAVERQAIRNL